MKLKINIILPYFGSRAGGGLKVMYEYATRLSNRGHDIVIYNSIKTNYGKDYDKSDFALKYKCFIKSLKGRERPKWFDLPDNVKCKMISYVSNDYIRDADICISTWWATAHHIAELNPSKGIKFNFIQGYETIMTSESEDFVHDSYKLPLIQVVISPYLFDIVSPYARYQVEIIPNALDLSIYELANPIENRNNRTLIMRYLSLKYKACQYGVAAFVELKNKYPDLEVIMFSSEKKPEFIPDWVAYYYDRKDIIPLYNEAAIYVATSITEGWHLPPMEAMACGCACVCTDIPAHLTYMVNGENALLVKPEDVDGLVDKISYLIDNPEERIQLAKRANQSIKKYDWECSVDQMEALFHKYMNKK
ncbi:glycosyltransferase family 4 protein [uncultured Dysgonomonas sp.]|uniref:Glycosyl transferase family 1 domain-containing protein n=1 Tax=uncultured Dysgonomonas sp. TaxID=206096 RepID=A0A212K2F5_9BACT|nr:glycosyltransferase family 4 protein [uncultured Dysgonomonas sp.]SBW05891.1 conserved hypothetical protein [uncultured Dysgonomonas sp.]